MDRDVRMVALDPDPDGMEESLAGLSPISDMIRQPFSAVSDGIL